MLNATTFSAQQLRLLATSDDPSLPMPPTYTWKNNGPNVVISDSSFGYMRYSARTRRGVSEFVSAVPALKSNRGWTGLLDLVVGGGELHNIASNMLEYADLVGVGHTDDGRLLVVPHDRAIVVFWSLNDICGKQGNWQYKMEHLTKDIQNVGRLAAYFGPIIFVIGGSARVWHLPPQYDRARDAICKIIVDHGGTVWHGEEMYIELCRNRHIKPRGVVDYWHFAHCDATIATYDRWLERIMRFASSCIFPVAWVHMFRHTVPATSSLPIDLSGERLDTYDAFEHWAVGSPSLRSPFEPAVRACPSRSVRLQMSRPLWSDLAVRACPPRLVFPRLAVGACPPRSARKCHLPPKTS